MEEALEELQYVYGLFFDEMEDGKLIAKQPLWIMGHTICGQFADDKERCRAMLVQHLYTLAQEGTDTYEVVFTRDNEEDYSLTITRETKYGKILRFTHQII